MFGKDRIMHSISIILSVLICYCTQHQSLHYTCTSIATLCVSLFVQIFVASAFVGALMDAGIIRVPAWLTIADVAVTFRVPLLRDAVRARDGAQ
jgi:hypothetical protein